MPLDHVRDVGARHLAGVAQGEDRADPGEGGAGRRGLADEGRRLLVCAGQSRQPEGVRGGSGSGPACS
ncbi:hypothetical protein [Streptomyces sp. NBC_01176]|uniref:hypothetical protein n=1 Tax=Streptomyces sp. NBC_01176 TaxID=2903760 RepID=UPI003863583D